MTMLSLLEQDCINSVDLDLDIVPDEASIDLAAALLSEAGRIDPALTHRLPQDLPPLPNFTAADLAIHRPALMHFARRKVRDEALAEDAVQDALIAAVTGIARYQGQSSLRSWLIGILNHKIHDIFRRETRYVSISDYDDEEDTFDRFGLDVSDESADPMRVVASARMRAALEREIEIMPPNLKVVFRMLALEGMTTLEVCEQLGIKEANCWVRLCRARKHLAVRMRHHLE
jgi:RNA polymerase sigma-70 factor, ECF subfamily